MVKEVNVKLDDLYFFTYLTSYPASGVMLVQHPTKRQTLAFLATCMFG